MTCMRELMELLREIQRERVAVAIRMHPETVEALRLEAAGNSPRITLAAADPASPPFYGLPLIADPDVPVGAHRFDYADGKP
jgi:hypothetical protein